MYILLHSTFMPICEITMKWTGLIIVMVWSAVSAGAGAAEGPNGLAEVSLERPDIDIMVFQSRLYKIQQRLSGKVTQTEAGLALLTEDGVYKLNGISVGDCLGEEVSVTGIVRDDNERKSIYVIKIEKNH